MDHAPSRIDSLVASSIRALIDNQQENGAFAASPDFSQYRGYCWLRDGSFVAYALDRSGLHEDAARFHRWCAMAIDAVAPLMEQALRRAERGEPVDPAAMPPARFALDGQVVDDDWPSFQLDGYGTWLWALREHLDRSGSELPPGFSGVIERTARYLAHLGTAPCYDVWEESGSSVHTATLACVVAGLAAASAMLSDPALAERAAEVRLQVLENARSEGRFAKSNDNRHVDGALLWLAAPFGLVAADDPIFVRTVQDVSTELRFEGGIRRFAADTYYGGGSWPILTALLGWQRAVIGDVEGAGGLLEWIADRVDAEGRLGEQFGGERRDPVMHAEWVRRWGPPAAELLWSHAMFIVLHDEIGRAIRRPEKPVRQDERAESDITT